MQDDNPETQDNRRIGSYMIYLMWIVLLAVAALLLEGWLDRRHNPNSRIEILASSEGRTEIILKRNAHGHYVASGFINGRDALFFLDTGATDVVIPAGITDGYGLKRGPSHQVHTANGVITVYSTRLDSIQLGPLGMRDIRANINPHMDGDSILLGMSFLKHLNITQRGDQLILGIAD
jgi:aspartyl protease family protein